VFVGVSLAVSTAVSVPVAVCVAVGVLVGGEHRFGTDALLRGFGAPVVKSAVFPSVSVQPASLLSTAVVLLGAGAGPLPSKQLALLPYPTRSIRLALAGHAPLSATELFSRATFPAVLLILMLPMLSGDGKSAEPPPPTASCTR
jgi:hypothetical protein